MNLRPPALVSVVFVLALAHTLPAQSNGQGTSDAVIPPPAVNLDIPPETEPDPAQIQQEELAIQALEQPQAFHDWLLSIQPGRERGEAEAAFALLHPDDYGRAHPKTPAQIVAEAQAAHAILNPHFPFPSGPN